MGDYRQHITLASVLGIGYAWAAYVLGGIHWVYGSVAALLATLGGLLPDLDSPSGVEMKGFTGILGVLAAVAVWHLLAVAQPVPAFEWHLWAVISAFVLVRHGLRRVAVRLSVHRGISHSLPTCAVWGAVTYLCYPSNNHALRLVMGLSVVLGFLSHLLLDEICSVDFNGARVNRAFGTALKFWAPSPWTTLGMYALLSVLSWRIIQTWPEQATGFVPPPPPPFPFRIPLPDGVDAPALRRALGR